jgi:CubicO group peptidase (beta-lactamase class C family)
MCLYKILFLSLLIASTSSYAESNPPEPEWLKFLLEEHRIKFNLPALAASIVVDGKIVAASVVGIRKYGDNTPTQLNDRFHIGSIAKPFSVTMFARFIEQGFFSWNDTLRNMFPDFSMQADYENVTIEQLLTHISGMPYQPTIPESETDKYGKTLQKKREGYVIAALKDKPEAKPGTKHIYGGGHILVANYVENLMGLSYEELMKEEIFIPLKLTTARFGSPSSPNKLDSPWEHIIENGKIKPVKPDYNQFQQARSPVGRNLCMSIIDLGRFAALHLKGSKGKSNYLKKETFNYLQTNSAEKNYSPAWAIGSANWAKGKILYHSGSTLKNLALCHIVPEENFAICIASNIWYDGLYQNFDKLNIEIAKLIQSDRTNN